MSIALSISPHGKLLVDFAAEDNGNSLSDAIQRRIVASFQTGDSVGLVHLATVELQTPLPPPLAYIREFAREYLTRLCHTPELDEGAIEPTNPPAIEHLAFLALQAPPMPGLEYLNATVLENWWTLLDQHVRHEISTTPGGATAWLRDKNPNWHLVGRVTFHLAEIKDDPTYPFAFMASYTERLSNQGRPQHKRLSHALEEYAGAHNRPALVSLLTPIYRAAERIDWVSELLESRELFQAIGWTPREAYALLRDLPALEDCGLIVRVPDWWKRKAAPRPQVRVKIGEAARSRLGVDALVDFRVNVALQDHELTPAELRELMNSPGGLVRFRGQWVELDKEKLAAALEHWKRVERQAGKEGISFFEGMRLLAGAPLSPDGADAVPADVQQWTGISPGEWLDQTLTELRQPDSAHAISLHGLKATLRPYQHAGVHWLTFMTRLGLGACLADDMGLGKTIQVLALLLHAKIQPQAASNLLVLPATLIANWQSEIAHFAPSLRTFVAVFGLDERELNFACNNIDQVRIADCGHESIYYLQRLLDANADFVLRHHQRAQVPIVPAATPGCERCGDGSDRRPHWIAAQGMMLPRRFPAPPHAHNTPTLMMHPAMARFDFKHPPSPVAAPMSNAGQYWRIRLRCCRASKFVLVCIDGRRMSVTLCVPVHSSLR